MEKKIRFRLNETDYSIVLHEESLALDWIRNVAGLKGTKEGCREGDCGACLVMMGGLSADSTSKAPVIEWLSVTSCTLALSELDGRHIITIEGLASLGLTPVMEAMLDEGASQCGFCSPGFVLALTNYLVTGTTLDPVAAMVAVEGNLCRCTGYGSIRRAAAILARDFKDMPSSFADRLEYLATRGVLPRILASLMKIPPEPAEPPATLAGSAKTMPRGAKNTVLGGGTDYFVRNPEPAPGLTLFFSGRDPKARLIRTIERSSEQWLELGSAVTVAEFFSSKLVEAMAPGIGAFAEDVASPPIRNRATLAGNIANASPIADMTAMLIALGARVVLTADAGSVREIPLEDFFMGYKKLDMRENERIQFIMLPAKPVRFNFEKVAKRARLDIASVNTAMAVRLQADGSIAQVRYSAGGIAAVPLRLKALEGLMLGKKPDADLARKVGTMAAGSGTPMDDVRGSSEYRKRLMERLAWAHFMRLWPELHLEEDLLS